MCSRIRKNTIIWKINKADVTNCYISAICCRSLAESINFFIILAIGTATAVPFLLYII